MILTKIEHVKLQAIWPRSQGKMPQVCSEAQLSTKQLHSGTVETFLTYVQLYSK